MAGRWAAAVAIAGVAFPQVSTGWPEYSVTFSRLRGDAVELLGWADQLGGSLSLLAAAITWGEFSGKGRLALPPGHGPLGDFLALPPELALEPHGIAWGGCSDSECEVVYRDAILRDHRRVMIKYVKPLLRVPLDSQKTAEDELVIHLRGGDSMAVGTFADMCVAPFTNPPCSFYDAIIGQGSGGSAFAHVRIVTDDMESPCIREIRERHPGARVVVQSGSEAEDAAAIINARYFVASPSLFSRMMVLMNEHARTVWVPKGTVSVALKPGYVPCGAEGEPMVIELEMPGMCRKWEDVAAKKKHMVDYPRGLVSVASVCSRSGHLELKYNGSPARSQPRPRAGRGGGAARVRFKNAAGVPLSVFAVEDMSEPGYHETPTGYHETPMGRVEPGASIAVPSHHGRTFIFRYGNETVHTHSVDISGGDEQLHTVGSSPEL